MNTALRNEIVATIATLSASAPGLASESRTDKLYELYVFSCVLRSLARIGATLGVRDTAGSPTSTLVFRLAPGILWSPTAGAGHVLAERKGKSYEVHNGLKVQGRSKVLHELDVTVIDHAKASKSRASRRHPKQTHAKFVAECKFYGCELPLHLGREFVGLSAEFTVRTKVLVSNQSSDNVHALVTSHRATERFGFVPSNAPGVDRFVEWLATEFEQNL